MRTSRVYDLWSKRVQVHNDNIITVIIYGNVIFWFELFKKKKK